MAANRTWLWGPHPTSAALWEPYAEAPGGRRLVQYFDKARMERNDYVPQEPESDWRVTNGLLAWELITGQVQIGDATFETREPAALPIAGDLSSATAPTYATLQVLLDAPAASDGEVIVQRLAGDGSVASDQALAGYGASAAHGVTLATLDHSVASPFWDFLNQSGTVLDDGRLVDLPLFSNPFYATGYPITEAYWLSIQLDGEERDVLVQCFERRCLTWTPGNPAGWEVESGNIGQHYFAWRYADSDVVWAEPRDYLLIALDPGHDRTTGGALGIEYQDTMRTALAARDALTAAGFQVFLARLDNEDVLIDDAELLPRDDELDAGYREGYAHLSAALRRDPDLFISLHYNGSVDPSSSGTAVYYSPAGGPRNEAFAAVMIDEILTAIRSVGYEPPYALALDDLTIGKTYGGLATLGNLHAGGGNRIVGLPAVLLEPLFETSPSERELIESHQLHAAIGAAIARAVERFID